MISLKLKFLGLASLVLNFVGQHPVVKMMSLAELESDVEICYVTADDEDEELRNDELEVSLRQPMMAEAPGDWHESRPLLSDGQSVESSVQY